MKPGTRVRTCTPYRPAEASTGTVEAVVDTWTLVRFDDNKTVEPWPASLLIATDTPAPVQVPSGMPLWAAVLAGIKGPR